MLLSIRRHTTSAELWDVLMVLSLISSFYTQPFQVEQKCSNGQVVMIMTGFTAHVCFMDLLLLWVLAILPFHNCVKSNKCTSG